MATAMDEYAPFDAGAGADVTEDTWRAMMRRTNVSGVVKSSLLELLPFGDSTGMQVKVNTGECVIESYWGRQNSTETLGIASNATGSTRFDLVIARANWVANQVELDVLTGTTVPPQLTRDTSKWEIPLGLVTVTNGAVTITAANVQDARQWGGPPVMTVTDDFLWWGDKISTCSRFNASGDSQIASGSLYTQRMHSLGEQTCSQIKLCPTVLPVGGTTTVRIFRGYRSDKLVDFIDPTTSTFLYGGSAGAEHVSAFTPTTFRAGETIVIAVAGSGTSTAATLASNLLTFSVGNATAFLNPSATVGPMVSGSKGAGMPTTINLYDGTWTKRDRVHWAALS